VPKRENEWPKNKQDKQNPPSNPAEAQAETAAVDQAGTEAVVQVVKAEVPVVVKAAVQAEIVADAPVVTAVDAPVVTADQAATAAWKVLPKSTSTNSSATASISTTRPTS